ncbi:MAG TPA: hypothetical protein PKU70_07160 [Vicinamibacteria bacterium]|nr:hypothetical protein [Vicinamibacteria bacterium]HRB12774.1 hypothetical protein [Vicinamibacteria bacterium]
MKNSPWLDGRHPGPYAGLLGLAALALLAGPTGAFAQCSLCRDAVTASSTQTREAMNYAIIGLAFAPYGVAALAAWTLSPAVRARVKEGLKRFSLRRAEKTS